MDLISIILVDYNSQEDTRECLESVLQINERSFRFKVIIVDNASKKSFTLTKKLDVKKVELIRSESNLGFTGGNNLAINYALKNHHPDYILLLNNDTVVDPNFLEEMLKCLKKDVSTGLVGAKTYFYKGREYHLDSYQRKDRGNVLWYAGASIDWLNLAAFHRGVDEIDRGQFDDQSETDFVTGCAMLAPVSVIERVGLLSEEYFLYLEDVDYSLRVKNAGYQLKFCPQAIVWHKNAGSSGGAGSFLHQYYQTRNRLFFGWKYGDRKVKLIVLRLIFRLLFHSTAIEKKAVADLVLGNMGKQPVV